MRLKATCYLYLVPFSEGILLLFGLSKYIPPYITTDKLFLVPYLLKYNCRTQSNLKSMGRTFNQIQTNFQIDKKRTGVGWEEESFWIGVGRERESFCLEWDRHDLFFFYSGLGLGCSRVFSVWVGWDTIENPLPSHPPLFNALDCINTLLSLCLGVLSLGWNFFFLRCCRFWDEVFVFLIFPLLQYPNLHISLIFDNLHGCDSLCPRTGWEKTLKTLIREYKYCTQYCTEHKDMRQDHSCSSHWHLKRPAGW